MKMYRKNENWCTTLKKVPSRSMKNLKKFSVRGKNYSDKIVNKERNLLNKYVTGDYSGKINKTFNNGLVGKNMKYGKKKKKYY